MDQIEFFNHLIVCKQMTGVKLFMLDSNTWNYLTLCKKTSSGLFKNVSCKLLANKPYIQYVYMYKQDSV